MDLKGGSVSMQSKEKQEAERVDVRKAGQGLTLRSMVVSVLVLFVIIYMANMGDYAGLMPALSLETMPIVPGIFVGLLLLLANMILRKLTKKFSFSDAEIISSYIFVTAGSMIANLGVVQSFAIAPAALRLNIDQRPELYQTFGERISSWLLPPSSTVWDFYLGGAEKVPWGQWLVPLTLWFVFFGLLVFLLDDVMSELDEGRRLKLLGILEQKVQTFITTTDFDNMDKSVAKKVDVFQVSNGSVRCRH
jgi:sterol desaturase/sphingolipid hydroxylase (fatty acid hydroxylase superfamily)